MRRILGLVSLLLLLGATASAQVNSRAMGKWAPSQVGDCTQAEHDSYFVVVEGKRYPTWHPSSLPHCTFAHEHGDSLDVPFGVVNEAAEEGPSYHRHEDHVGHKITVFTDHVFRPQNATVPADSITCSGYVKIHQGTHSPDAFTNNLHEQITSIRCSNGFAFDLQLLSAIGRAGTLTKQCAPQAVLTTGPAVPEDSPIRSFPLVTSMGHRFLPTSGCIEVARPNYHEVWKTQNPIYGVDGRQAVRFAWYWNVSNPSRYYDDGVLGRQIDQCWAVVNGAFRTISNPCVTVRKEAAGVPYGWDDPRSPFKGTDRSIRLNDFSVNVRDGQVWYTDVLGANPSLSPFPGSVRQFAIGSHPGVYAFTGLGAGTDNTDPRVRAPN